MPDTERRTIGPGVDIALRYCECSDPACDHTKPCGLWWWHKRPGTEVECENSGYIPLRGPSGWSLESMEPLTLTPSLLCMRSECGRHGFIEGGAWRDV